MLIYNLLFSTINYIKLWMNLKKKKTKITKWKNFRKNKFTV